MALIYIMPHDGGGLSGRYRQYDIVDICDDCPVNIPPAPSFYIVKIIGVTKAQVSRFLAAHTDGVGRRLWKFDIAAIPTAWKNELVANRYNECTVAQARKYILNKVTNLHDDGS